MDSKVIKLLIGALIVLNVDVIAGAVIGTYRQPDTLPEDLNKDGEVDLRDFSIAAHTLGNVMAMLRAEQEHTPANEPEEIYPPVPLPYQTSN